jgi:arginyl-tRNA synthetase
MIYLSSMITPIIKLKLKQAAKATLNIDIDENDIQVDNPSLESFGDYTTNIAMSLNQFLPKEEKQKPVSIAEKLANYLKQEDKQQLFEKIEVVEPGFINCIVSLSYLTNFLSKPIEKIKKPIHKEKILVEHTGPNTNKPLHIGHIRNATLGTAVLNILKESGYNVIAANINNDRGIHIIKSMYGYLIYGKKEELNQAVIDYKALLSEWKSSPEHWHTPQSKQMKPDHFVGYYYVLGNNDYEDSEKKDKEAGTNSSNAPYNQMQQMLVDWEAEEENVRALWLQNNNWFYQGMHQTLTDFGIHTPNDPSKYFDKEWYESEIYKEGKDIVFEKIGNGIITEFEDGHVEAVLEKYNLPNIVLLRKNKTSLYITQDIEMLRQRIKEDQNDKIIYLTDAGQNLRFKQLFAVGESLGIGKLDQMIHLGYGTVRLPEGKMSSRKGTVIVADQLLEEVKQKAKEKINQERSSYSEQEKEEISKSVALAAIKYGILKYNALSNIIFDIQNSISFEGDTGPYLQYTHARACSILRKIEKSTISNLEIKPEETDQFSEEISIMRHLIKFDEVIIKSSINYTPNYICEYLFNLAQKFNLMYANKQVLSEKNTSTQNLRLQITTKTRDTLHHGLNILGINAPEKM